VTAVLIWQRTSFVSTTDSSGNTSTFREALERRFADSERCGLATAFSDTPTQLQQISFLFETTECIQMV